MVNKVVVKINGVEYTLMGEDSEDYLFSIANFVDKKIKEILSSNPKHNTTSSAVLTALTVTDEMFKLKKEMEKLRQSTVVPTEKLREAEERYRTLYEEFKKVIEENNSAKSKLQEVSLKEKEYSEGINKLKAEYEEKIKEYEALLKENAFLRERNEEAERELKETKEMLNSVKEQLLESQIELVRVKKDLKDFKELQSKKRSV
ncbi:MAG: cell division protein ZapA [Caloramator sp.]|nr:cell division protein ZapA [Caloramator sp.]